MPNKNPLLVLAFLVFAVACNKDKFTSAPQVKIKSISPANATQGNQVQIKGSFTDDEGDIDSALVIYKWYNGDVVTKKDTIRDYLISNIALPVGTRSGDFVITFLYGVFGDFPTLPSTPVAKDTTATLGLLFVDKQNQRSAYVESEKIRLIKP
jgi:hypothetical protein